MARSVGSIEVEVEADTGRLTAQLRRAGEVAGKAAKDAIDKQLADIGGRALTRRLVELRGEIEEFLAVDVEVGIQVPARELAEAQARLDELHGTVEVGTDVATTELSATVGRIEAALQGIEAHIGVDVDTTDALAAKAVINATLGEIEVSIEPKIDKVAKAEADALLERNMRETGRKAGRGFGQNLLSGDSTKLLVLAGVSMGDALVSGLSGSIAAGTSVVSSAIRAMAAAAGAGSPIVAALGEALGAVVVGTRGVSDAMKAVTKEFEAAAVEGRAVDLTTGDVGVALSKLSPSARDAATAFGDLRDELHDVRIDVQEQLFAGFAEVVSDLGTDVLPDVSKALQVSASSVNEFGKQLADIARNTDFEDMAKALQPALDNAFDAATALADTLEPFLEAAAPAAERLADMIERGAEGLRDWVQANPTEITEFLDDGIDSLEQWVQLVGSVADLLGTVFAAGRDQGDSFVQSLDDMITRWDTFLESVEGQTALEDFFRTGRETMDALKPVLDGLREAFGTLIGDDTPAAFADLADALGRALPAFGELIDLTSRLRLGEAFLNIVDAAEPLLDLLGRIPDAVFELAGTALVVGKLASAFGSVAEAAAKAARATALFAFENPALAGVIAAIGLAVFAWEQLTDSNKEAEQAASEFARQLRATTDEIIRSGDVAAGAAVGVKAFNDSLADSEGFDAVKAALGVFGRDVDDARGTLSGLAHDTERELTDLGVAFGIPRDAAAELGRFVDMTDESFKSFDDSREVTKSTLERLAAQTGKSKEELLKAAAAMEVLTDQSASLVPGLEKQAETALAAAKGGTELEKAALAAAEAQQAQGAVVGGLIPLHDEYLRQLNLLTAGSKDATNAQVVYGDALDHIDQAIREANQAAEERAAALKAEHDAAFDAWQEEKTLARETENAAIAAADAMGFSADLASEFVDLGNAAREAADKAAAFKDTIDLLITPAADVQASLRDVEQGIDDMTEALEGGTEATTLREEAWTKMVESQDKSNTAEEAQKLRDESKAAADAAAALVEHAHSLDISNQAGRDNADMLATQAENYLTLAANMLTQGSSAAEVNAKMAESRTALEGMATGFGLTAEEASAYVDTLLGTPELLTTVIETPGLTDALLNAADLTVLYDEVGNPVITEFEALGLDPALASSAEFKGLLEQLGQIHAAPTVDASGAVIAQEDVGTVQTAVDTLNISSAAPDISIPAGATVEEKLSILTNAINNLDVLVAEPTITIPFIDTNIDRVHDLTDAINQMPLSKTITINVQTNGAVLPPGSGFDIPGGMAGELLTHPTIRRVGERGLTEAIVPLQLPLNRVDPSVRHLAELLRGGGDGTGGGGTTIHRQVNVAQTITPTSADPRAVATQVINRAAALANR